MSDAYQLDTWLWLPRPRAEVFTFFADARNLERITPAFLRFRVLTRGPIDMRAGARIDYRLGLHGVPIAWRTEITAWEPPARFVDTQLRGPYRQWIHTHTFEPDGDGTLVRDRVLYRLRGPSLATRLINRLLVAPDTRRIFEFRHQALLDAFDARGRARVGPVEIRAVRA